MKDDVVFDTNILVYAFDTDEPKKRAICAPLVEGVSEGGFGIVTNQITAEFYNVLTRKQKVPAETAGRLVSKFIQSPNWIKVNYTHETVERAIFLSSAFSVSIWDALVAATMLENNLSKIYTENTRDFRKIPGIKAVNPMR